MITELARRPMSGPERQLKDFQREAERIDRDRDRLKENIQPSGLAGKLRSTLVRNPLSRRFLPEEVREFLDQSAEERLLAAERQNILELIEAFPRLTRGTREFVEYGEKLKGYLALINGEELPADIEEDDFRFAGLTEEEALEELDRVLNEKAEADLGRMMNRETEDILEMLRRKDPNYESRRKQAIVDQAEQFLAFEGVNLMAAAQSLRFSAEYLDKAKRTYSNDLNFKELSQDIAQATANVRRAQELGIQSFNTKMGSLSLAMRQLEIVAKYETAVQDFYRDVAPVHLQDLQNKAQNLRIHLEQSALPQPSAGFRALPSKTQRGEGV